MSTKIQNILSRYVLDSRGFPTVEAEVLLSDGKRGKACVPSGASTGDKEALELRDLGNAWAGKGVEKALNSIQNHITPLIIGESPFDIGGIDNMMINLDGTENLPFTWSAANKFMSELCPFWIKKNPSLEIVLLMIGVLEDPFATSDLINRIPTLMRRFVSRFKRNNRSNSFETLDSTMTVHGALK